LRRLLADLLTASRLQASALEIHPAPVRVADVVRDAVATVQSTQPTADIRYDGLADVTVEGDRDRLAQAVDNLLTNALRHGVPPVTVAVLASADRVEIRVSDQGGGVPADVQERLFDRFATGRSRGGTGLGLFIVRELARAHGGDASYEPGPAGSSGGAFVITLPRAPRAAD
jgi:signal transduction histidine kinase